MVAIYANDWITFGSDKDIKEVIEDLKKHDYGFKIEEDLKDYLICHIKIDKGDGIV
jgi:hypothetical protein